MGQGKKIILIDGNGMLYRAFYGLPSLINSQGIPTGGVYGFTRMLLRLLREENPEYLVCTFDKGKKTFRHIKFPKYKATRRPTPKELISQITLVKEMLTCLNILSFEEEEYEADDLLATLAVKATQENLQVVIISGDKDLLQLASPSVSIIRFKRGISQTEIFDPEKVKEHFGVSPPQIPDLLALMGDTSDNIPGVPGIGPVTASRLIQKYGNLEKLLQNLAYLPPKISNLLQKHFNEIKLSKDLTTLRNKIPLKVNLEELKRKQPHPKKLLSLLKRLEFIQLIKEFPALAYNDEEKWIDISDEEVLRKFILSLKKVPLILELGEKDSPGIAIYLTKSERCYWLSFSNSNLKEEEILEKLRPVLEDKQIEKSGHNLKKTFLWLRRKGIKVEGLAFDTELAAYVLNSSRSNYSLQNLSLHYLGLLVEKQFLAPSRVRLIRQLIPLLKEKIEKEGLNKLYYQTELPLLKVLVNMEEKGIKINREALKDFLQEIMGKRKKLKEEIYQKAGERFNINSSPQLGEILFEKLNLPRLKKTKTGYSTDEETLQTLSLLQPWIGKIVEYRRLFKLESTYIKPLPKMVNPETGRLHTSFNQTATATGRLSSSHPNLQNIPIRNKMGEKIRQAFIAEEGYLLLSADYSQIELRIMAHLSQDPNLKSAFLRGEDIHQQTAAEIFNLLPLQVTPQMRRKAKTVNFGIIYGISSYGLSRDLNISESEAEEYIKKYFQRYPKVKEYIENTLNKARRTGYVTTFLGRKRYLPEILSPKRRRREFAQRTAINSPVQGGAADLIKLAMINLSRRLRKEKLRGRMILQIHDELLLEVPGEEITLTRKIVKEEMEGAIKLSVPLIVDSKIGKNWAEMKS